MKGKTNRKRIDAEKRERNQEMRAVSLLMSEAKRLPHKKRETCDLSVDVSQATPNTDAELIRLVQRSIRPVLSGMSQRESRDAAVRFDAIYRPFIFRTLLADKDKGGFGFKGVRQERAAGAFARVPMRGGISGEDVYSAVYEKLFGAKGLVCNAALIKFDASRDRVGQGAFRKYLREVIRSVIGDMTRKEYVKEKDVHGRVLYRVYASGPRKGQYILNDKGEKIPRMVPKYQQTEDDVLAIVEAEHRKATATAPSAIYKRKLDLHYLAYTILHESLRQTGWFYDASAQIYEKGVPRDIVLKECLDRQVIADRRAFDKAISIFSRKVLEKAKELEKVIYSDRTVRSKDGRKVLSEEQLVEQAWEKVAEKVGSGRVQDIRTRVMRGLIKDIERKMDEEASGKAR